MKTAQPAQAKDPAFAVLIAEQQTLLSAYSKTRLCALTEANLAALREWIANDNAETLLALRDADRALEAESAAELRSHRAALGVR